jgi:hypothetical protein
LGVNFDPAMLMNTEEFQPLKLIEEVDGKPAHWDNSDVKAFSDLYEPYYKACLTPAGKNEIESS